MSQIDANHVKETAIRKDNNTDKKSNVKGANRVIIAKPKKKFSLIVASSAIFSGLSLALSQLAPILPRIQWGLALFDPVSIIWIMAFFLFGFEAGILTSLIGMLLLMPFDAFAPLGPIMKFSATLPLILVPSLIVKIKSRKIESNEILKTRQSIFYWLISVAIRAVIMTIFNIVAINLMFGGDDFANTIDLSFLGIPSITGWMAIVITVVFVNSLQSIWDYWIPYGLIVIFKKYRSLPW
ncbi:MAG: hypothetical protein ACTSRZ_13330 [Promethearchaeota archaeon]